MFIELFRAIHRIITFDWINLNIDGFLDFKHLCNLKYTVVYSPLCGNNTGDRGIGKYFPRNSDTSTIDARLRRQNSRRRAFVIQCRWVKKAASS